MNSLLGLSDSSYLEIRLNLGVGFEKSKTYDSKTFLAKRSNKNVLLDKSIDDFIHFGFECSHVEV